MGTLSRNVTRVAAAIGKAFGMVRSNRQAIPVEAKPVQRGTDPSGGYTSFLPGWLFGGSQELRIARAEKWAVDWLHNQFWNGSLLKVARTSTRLDYIHRGHRHRRQRVAS